MARWLPFELIMEILSRLPANSLWRFKCVSKQWFGLITHPDQGFLKSNLKRSKPGILVVLKDPEQNNTQFCYAQDYTSCNNLTKFQFPGDYRVVNVCNGLLFFVDFYTEHDSIPHVWNPITGDHITLPPTSSNPSYLLPGVPGFERFRQIDILYGFGFDPDSNVYKAIRFVSSPPEEVGGDCDSHVTVFTLGQDSSWRTLPKIHYHIGFDHFSNALVDGVLVWFGPMLNEATEHNSPKRFLIAFKIQEEAFQEIPQPDDISSDNMLNKKVGVLGGLLSIFCNFELRYWIDIDIWVMGTYGVADSWKKHYTIVHPGVSGPFMRLLGDANSREIIISRDAQELFSYDLNTDLFTNLHTFDSHDDSFVSETHLFKGSLLSPKIINRPSRQAT